MTQLFCQVMTDKKYNEEYWGRLERNWKWQKGKQRNERRALETIREKKEEIKQKELEIKEQMEKDKDKISNIVDPYYKL